LEAKISFGGEIMEKFNPPIGGTIATKPCTHKFVHLETVKERPRSIPNSYSVLGWKRIDRFYCEKCLEQKEFVKTAPHYENQPDWF
jgi:hypothetical protein